ncbi:MAG: response regulator [Candidatus Marinimicrobia bacterium]|nr:response regulator [Candidatus Neomarinimicrobiota bacterium]
MAHILIVEDEIEMAYGLRDNFEFDGHTVTLAHDGNSGLDQALKSEFNLIILDLMLPEKSGFDVCKDLRASGIETPVIMLTARGQEVDKVRGLEIGADDYITKPFSVRELLARVKAVLRRTANSNGKSESKVTIGKATIDFDHYTAHTEEKGDVELTHKEIELLKYFFEHPDKVITRDELLDKVWGYENYPTTRTVDNYIVKLRKLIEDNPSKPKHILTIHGAGYKFIL